MNTLTSRVLNSLPLELQALCCAHNRDDLDEIVQTTAVSLLEAPGLGLDKVFARARSTSRRFTQDVAHYSRPLHPDCDAAGEEEETACGSRKQVRRKIEADLKLSTRAAQRVIKKQLDRMHESGDLFTSNNSGVAA